MPPDAAPNLTNVLVSLLSAAVLGACSTGAADAPSTAVVAADAGVGAGGAHPGDAGAGGAPVDAGATVDAGALGHADLAADFLSTEVLGRPTASAVTVSAVPKKAMGVFFEYGTTKGVYPSQTALVSRAAAEPFLATIDGLSPDTQYVYRVRWRAEAGAAFSAGPERTFHTARPKGKPFTFVIQSDAHLDENSSLELYRTALGNELADAPDFLLDLGDTFMCEKHSAPLDATDQAAPDIPTVRARYLYEHVNFATVAHSAPLFLVNGNHEGELGWLQDGTADNLAVWTTLARKSYFAVPFPDAFYSGSSAEEPFVGQRGSSFAFEWGDVLFVALDPFWNTKTNSKTDAWVWTLGQDQFQWLAATLTNSSAPFRFVFLHHLVGGLDGVARGGVEAAPYYEWGGKNADGTPGFDAHRPGWEKPIHQLLVENHVTAVFHGHDHLYAKQELDGVVYQEVPQPSAPSFASGPALAKKFHYTSGVISSSAGHLRVQVDAGQAKVDYVRAYRPEDTSASVKNGDVSETYVLAPR